MVVAAVAVALAAAVAGRVAGEGTDAAGDQEAGRALIGVFAGDLASRKREIVAGWFARDAEVGAGLPPFRTMDFDAAAAGAPVGKEVGGFVAQCPEHLGMADGVEPRIEFNDRGAGAGCARGRLQAGIPDDGKALGDGAGSGVVEPGGGEGGEAGIRSGEGGVGGRKGIGGAQWGSLRRVALERGEFSVSSHG